MTKEEYNQVLKDLKESYDQKRTELERLCQIQLSLQRRGYLEGSYGNN